MVENVNYKTSDLSEAATLKCLGHTLESIDKTQRRASFCFAKKPITEDILNRYRERVLLVEPYAFFQCLREIKDRLYND